MNYYLKYLLIAIIFVFMDFGWIMMNKDLYLGTIKKVQKSEHKLMNLLYIPLTYIAMWSGLFIICFSFVDIQIEKYKNKNKNIIAFISGGFYGIIVNSIYNFTSLVAYKDYSIRATILDIIWAFVLYGTVSVIYLHL